VTHCRLPQVLVLFYLVSPKWSYCLMELIEVKLLALDANFWGGLAVRALMVDG
jgi:hypothetical protein